MIKGFLLALLGALIGAFATLAYFYSLEGRNGKSNIEYADLFKMENRVISEERFSCEGFKDRKVGTVLAAIFELNDRSPLNRITKGCFDNKCSVSYGSCRPWQSDGCGSTVLYFEQTQDGDIVPDSIECIQMP